MMADIIDRAIERLIIEGKVIREGDNIRENPFYVYVRGLATMPLGAPKGLPVEVHIAKRMREIRNGARLLMGEAAEHD
jgi:hypothetical protein